MEWANSSEGTSPVRRRLLYGVLGVLLATASGLAIKERHEIVDRIEDIAPDKSSIVAGVPVQVERGGYAHTNGGNREYNLYVEQCPADVDAARRGEQTASAIDPKVGTIGHGCIGDYILVDSDTYATVQPGAIMTFGLHRDKFDLLRGHPPKNAG